ncbi:MAG: hypothetical protein ACXVB4_16240 [Pseudobdellovibrionaceae bacterium]
MTILNSTTGHDAKKERSIGRLIYLIIGVAVSVAIIIFWLIGTGKNLNPYKSGEPAKNAPDKTPGKGTNPGTVPPSEFSP